MKHIPDTFTQHGWNLELVERQGDMAIYQRSKPGGLPPHYEVVRLRQRDAYQLGGRDIPAGETYPSSRVWGKDGFTCPTLAKAREKFLTMLA